MNTNNIPAELPVIHGHFGLHDYADLITILTGVLALVAWLNYKHGFHKKRQALEKYLEKESIEGPKRGEIGRHTIRHLTAVLGLTESEILQASFESKTVRRRVFTDQNTNVAGELFFEYKKHPN
jgi:hypothetical protein